MITLRVIGHSGAIEASALVTDRFTGFAWFEHCTYYGYRKGEVRKLFRQYLKDKGMRIVGGK